MSVYFLPTTGLLGGADAVSTDGLVSIALATSACPTTDDQLQWLLRWLPSYYDVFEPILAGMGRTGATSVCVVQDLAHNTKVAGASGKWLTLLAEGYGIQRGSGETDSSLRYRLRNPEEKLTVESIEGVVNQILAPYSSTLCILLEHWANGVYCDTSVVEYAGICDNSYLYDVHNAFTLIIPDLGSLTHPAIAAIINSVNETRAAGVRWYLVVR